MKTREAWKSWERVIARDFGGTRLPVSGRQRGDQADLDVPVFSVEVKCGRTALSAAKIILAQAQARAAAARNGKLPVSVHVMSTQGVQAFKVVVVPYDVFVREFVGQQEAKDG